MALDLQGKRVTLIGLGTRGGGLGVARFLVAQGAEVTVTDLRPADTLAEPLAGLTGLPIRYVLGRHAERDFTPDGTDLVVRNPGVPRRAPLLELARSHGIPIEMEMSLFFRACPAPIVGVTGTKGKTTVSVLIGDLLRRSFPEAVVAGNMGVSALDQLPCLRPDVPVVIELSSWQLEALIEHGLAPRIAVLTLIAEDHLNTYDDFTDYANTKRGITRHQRPGDWLVVNRDDPEAWRAATEAQATIVPFGEGDAGEDGAWLTAEGLLWRWRGVEHWWPHPQSAALAGRHAAGNALAALAAATLAGASAEAIGRGLTHFRGVKDRLESVAEIDGVTYINDTTATAPIAVVAALDALAPSARRVHLLAGGADKRLDPSPLAEAAARHGATVYLFEGSASPGLASSLRERGVVPHGPFEGMAEALSASRCEARPGDVVLLSPGCASFGLFRDEFDRGERFREAVAALRRDHPSSPTLLPSERGEGSRATAAAASPPLPAPTGEGGWGVRAGANLLPPTPAHVHFVGIGGIGMSGLARVLNAWGYTVSGSDAAASPLLQELETEGIAVTIGHTATETAAAANLVVATAAVQPDNPEVGAALAAHRPVVKRARLLGALTDARRGVAVAGSHGKSTTSGMIVTALRALGADPSFAIGAVLASAGTNAAPGSGAEMVVEADEYDWSFLQLHPDIAIVTNVEYDHPDLFPDTETYDAAFAAFVAGMRSEGTLVIAADDSGSLRVMDRADWAPPRDVVTFGETGDADWRLEQTDEGWRVTGPDDIAVPLTIRVPGRHHARNAIAALAALVALGYDAAASAAALESFTGVGRRFETKGEARGVTVIDDYAHHPSEVAVNLRTAKDHFPGRRLWAIFQPHTFSRLKALLPDFAAAFGDADRAMILDVYAARETDDLGISAGDLIRLLPADTLRAKDPADAARILAGAVEPGDVVLTLGAGSITETGPKLLEFMRESPVESAPPAAEEAPLPSQWERGWGEGRPWRDRRSITATKSRDRNRATTDTIAIPNHPTLKLLRDAPMRLHTTWRIGGPADFLVRAATPDDLLAAIAWGRGQGLPVTVIGGGSNLLVGDGGIRGLIVLARTPGERATDLVAVEDLGDAVRLRVAAQAPLSWTGRYAAERGWAGMDWGVGLPGTIGGATVNNAGAHGMEQIDHLESVSILNDQGEIEEQPAAWLEAAYRHTIVKAAPRPRPWIVLAATMLLPKGDLAELVRLADEHAAFRKETQPTGACAGSTFANPDGDFAGRLLEESGLKGFAVGGAAFSPKHANWIVNDGTATAADVRELIATAQARVRERFGVELRREVEYLGD